MTLPPAPPAPAAPRQNNPYEGYVPITARSLAADRHPVPAYLMPELRRQAYPITTTARQPLEGVTISRYGNLLGACRHFPHARPGDFLHVELYVDRLVVRLWAAAGNAGP